MKSNSYPRLTVGLTTAVVLLCLLCGWLYWQRTWLAIEVAFAADQTEIFERMRSKALGTSNPAEIVGYLRYAVEYYPSGTKQLPGSPLDQIVERCRTSAIRDIIAHIRLKTSEDLGDDPRRWIDKYVEN